MMRAMLDHASHHPDHHLRDFLIGGLSFCPGGRCGQARNLGIRRRPWKAIEKRGIYAYTE
jgi:hypothetical protein